jgi:hypothetical protein
VAAVLLLAQLGCGGLPTAPILERSTRPAPDPIANSSGRTPQPPPAPGGLTEEIGLPLPIEVGPVVVEESEIDKTVNVNGGTGGRIDVGTVGVQVPRNAFQGQALIKLTVPDPSRLECWLEISPASKNHFDVPVQLQFDASSVPDVRVMTVYWYDEEWREWVPIVCDVNKDTKKITADLPHFSHYKVDSEVQGRAGW